MKQITLSKTQGGWMATYHNDSRIVELFGTATIPTAFTEKAESGEVLATIARLNPTHVVSITNR